MEMKGYIISGVKVINIVEENAASIEKMANKMITDLHNKNIKILDLQITGDNLILVIGEKEWSSYHEFYIKQRKNHLASCFILKSFSRVNFLQLFSAPMNVFRMPNFKLKIFIY